MAIYVEDYYDGFRTFSWLADFVGVPIDQVNFLLAQITALISAGFLRTFLSPRSATPVMRHVFGLIIGLFLGYFCYGRQAIHLAGLPALCYIAMRTQDPRNMQRVVLATAMIYLSCVHYHRQMYNYGSYTLDITGPLMVITQKVTSLAYNIHDGLTKREEELTPMQCHQAVRKIPTTLEFFSYVFHFQTLMAGPVIFYRDYADFIDGSNFAGKALSGDKNSGRYGEIVMEPSPMRIVVKKVLASLLYAAIFVTYIPAYPIEKLKDDDFVKNSTIVSSIWYIMIATMLVRFKYYHAWTFADAICNNSGLGFSGYSENGEAQWDMLSNVDVIKFETSLSARDSIDQWNKGTNLWLRSLVYERCGRYKLQLTYMLSALWHGFYPGYYLTFANGAFFTIVWRSARRKIRPLFLASKETKFLYDVITFVAARVTMAYMTFSFVLLEFVPSIRMYLHLYMFLHWMGLVIILLAYWVPRRDTHKKSTRNEAEASTQSEISNGNARKTK